MTLSIRDKRIQSEIKLLESYLNAGTITFGENSPVVGYHLHVSTNFNNSF